MSDQPIACNKIKTHLQELCREYKKEVIVIGGWAVHAHKAKKWSLDGDAVISNNVNGELRDQYMVFNTPRLKKSQYAVDDFEVDIYVEYQNGLKVPLEELQQEAQFKESMWVACPEHLVILKIEAIKGRGNTPKGKKDKMDLVSLLNVVKSNPKCEVLNKYIDTQEKEIIDLVINDPNVYLEITEGNPHEAKKLKSVTSKNVKELYELCELHQTGPEI